MHFKRYRVLSPKTTCCTFCACRVLLHPLPKTHVGYSTLPGGENFQLVSTYALPCCLVLGRCLSSSVCVCVLFRGLRFKGLGLFTVVSLSHIQDIQKIRLSQGRCRRFRFRVWGLWSSESHMHQRFDLLQQFVQRDVRCHSYHRNLYGVVRRFGGIK